MTKPWEHGFTVRMRCNFAQIVWVAGFDLF